MIIKYDWSKRKKRYRATKRSNKKKILLIGYSKSGKTRLASTAPNPLFINTDHSMEGIHPDSDPEVVDIFRTDKNIGETVREAIFAVRDRKEGFENIETLVFDGVTTLSDFLLYEAMLNSEISRKVHDPFLQKPERDEYGIIKNILMSLFTLIDELDCHIIATAGIKLDTPDSKTGKKKMDGYTSIRSTILPDIAGSFRDSIAGRFTGVFFMDERNRKYYAYPYHPENIAVGVRNWMGPPKVENPDFQKLLDGFDPDKKFIVDESNKLSL